MSEAPSFSVSNSSVASPSLQVSPIISDDVPTLIESTPIPVSNPNVVEEVVPAIVPKPPKLRSKVWDDFTRVKLPNGDFEATCKHCKKKFKANSAQGTTHLRNHLDVCWARVRNNSGQRLLANRRGANQTIDLTTWKFDPQVTRECFAKMISTHDYAFNMAEHYYFQLFVHSIDPKVRLYTRNTVRGDVVKMFKEMKVEMTDFFGQLKSKISLTTDIWTSDHQNKSYSCVTCHFIDDDWKLRKKVIAYPLFPPPHTGVFLGEAIKKISLEWNIDSKLFSISVDNASNNDSMIRFLKQWLVPKGFLPNHGDLFHVRCSCHILNLIVHDGLKPIKPFLKKIRKSVIYVKATHSRKQEFDRILDQLKLSSKGLTCDVKTRWNSTYLMLEHALELELVFVRLADYDDDYVHLPSNESWVVGRLIVGCLKIFYMITLQFSMVKYPTANLYFVHVFTIRKYINEWITSEHLCIREMALKMKLKFDKYWSSSSLLMIIGMILDPRYKMRFVEFAFGKLYPEHKEIQLKKVHDSLADLYLHYKIQSGPSLETSCSSFPGVNSRSFPPPSGVESVGSYSLETDNEFNNFMKEKYIHEPPVQKFELDLYFEEDLLPKDEAEFDILIWWRMNSPRFPILGKIARDVLAVPVSTVASESAF